MKENGATQNYQACLDVIFATGCRRQPFRQTKGVADQQADDHGEEDRFKTGALDEGGGGDGAGKPGQQEDSHEGEKELPPVALAHKEISEICEQCNNHCNSNKVLHYRRNNDHEEKDQTTHNGGYPIFIL